MSASSLELLRGLAKVTSVPLLDIAPALSDVLGDLVGHAALVILTEDCAGRPRKKAGVRDVTDRVSLAELDAFRSRVERRGTPLLNVRADIAQTERPVSGWLAETGALLVIAEPVTLVPPQLGGLIQALWELVAIDIWHRVDVGRPDDLHDSRMASLERARVIEELTDAHLITLESLLGVLRSRETSDADARHLSTEISAAAIVDIRAASVLDRAMSEERVTAAFDRMRASLRPVTRFSAVEVEFVEPPANGRDIPGEVAHAGRAIVRGAVLGEIESEAVTRIRIQWDCDGSNLIIHIRDDGPGDLTVESTSIRETRRRVDALGGTLAIDSTAGWGSAMLVTLPLDAPKVDGTILTEWALTGREQAVLQLIAGGARNRAIADALSISENTVKFHVRNLLRKVGVSSRAELAAALR